MRPSGRSIRSTKSGPLRISRIISFSLFPYRYPASRTLLIYILPSAIIFPTIPKDNRWRSCLSQDLCTSLINPLTIKSTTDASQAACCAVLFSEEATCANRPLKNFGLLLGNAFGVVALFGQATVKSEQSTTRRSASFTSGCYLPGGF